MKDVIPLYNASTEKAVEIKNKRVYIDQRMIEQKFDKIQTQLAQAEAMKIDPAKGYKKGQIGAQNDAYQSVIEKKLPFINELLSEIVPVAAGNVYLIGGVTGGGKSTTVANIIIPILDAGRKILVITNEERRSDVYSRVACRNLGQSFYKLKRGLLHSEVRRLINIECERLEDVMTVIGTDFQDNPDMVCTPEGLKTVLEHFAPGHDVILFDYYQNITQSRVNDDPAPWVHQATFSTYLNIFKNGFNGPIFVMSQLMDGDGAKSSFKERIEGRKSIANVAPVHIEIKPNKEDYTTIFHVHKDRLTSNDGARMRMGFDKDTGRYVVNDDAFKAKAAHWIAERLTLAASGENQKVEQALKEGEMVDDLRTNGDKTTEAKDELDFDSWTVE
jgi:hypothetical protein